jgi:hypothetical protein
VFYAFENPQLSTHIYLENTRKPISKTISNISRIARSVETDLRFVFYALENPRVLTCIEKNRLEPVEAHSLFKSKNEELVLEHGLLYARYSRDR